MSVPPAICLFCRRFHAGRKDETSCDAFPEAIPAAILRSELDHRQAVDGDHGLRFDPINEDAAAYAAKLFPEPPGAAPSDQAVDR